MEKETGYRVVVQPMAGQPYWLSIKQGDKYVCSLLTVISKGPEGVVAALLNIWTEKKFRRQGHAKELIEKLKGFGGNRINFIFTSWKDSNPEGRKLMLACGFTHREDVFEWRRMVAKTEKPKLALLRDPVQTLKDLQAGR